MPDKEPEYNLFPRVFVRCPFCGKNYDEQDCKALEIEEGPTGEDVLTFYCPEGHVAKSLRRRQ